MDRSQPIVINPESHHRRASQIHYRHYSSSQPTYLAHSAPESSTASLPWSVPIHGTEAEADKVISHCTTLSDKVSHLKLQLINAQNFHASSEVQPWLDDLIGKANEVLNALLRIRKYQMAEEYQQAQYNEERQRKRGKKPVFQGRCHSCQISETPEWRRGPDGARTLCNACGLHYAKLVRKRAAAGTSTSTLPSSPQKGSPSSAPIDEDTT